MGHLMRPSLLYLLLGLSLLFSKCVYDHGQRQLGVAQERARVADSTVKAQTRAVRAVDTVYRRDTLRLTRTVAQWRERVVQRFDTLSDTVSIPIETVRWVVAQGDSVVTACRSVLLTCEQRVATRDTLIVALERRNALTREQVRRDVLRKWGERAIWAGLVMLVAKD